MIFIIHKVVILIHGTLFYSVVGNTVYLYCGAVQSFKLHSYRMEKKKKTKQVNLNANTQFTYSDVLEIVLVKDMYSKMLLQKRKRLSRKHFEDANMFSYLIFRSFT